MSDIKTMRLELKKTNGAWVRILTGIEESRVSEVRLAAVELSCIVAENASAAEKTSQKPPTWRMVSEGDGRVVGYCNEGCWTPLYHIERVRIMPSTSNVEAFSESSDKDDGERYKRAMNAILQAAARGWRERVALGTVPAPRNKAVDPATLTSSERVCMPEPMTPNDINLAAGVELASLLDHIYENGTTSEGVMPLAVAFVRAIEAEVLRRVKGANNG